MQLSSKLIQRPSIELKMYVDLHKTDVKTLACAQKKGIPRANIRCRFSINLRLNFLHKTSILQKPTSYDSSHLRQRLFAKPTFYVKAVPIPFLFISSIVNKNTCVCVCVKTEIQD